MDIVIPRWMNYLKFERRIVEVARYQITDYGPSRIYTFEKLPREVVILWLQIAREGKHAGKQKTCGGF